MSALQLENIMQKSPLAIVKERFGDKAGLIKAIQGLQNDDLWLDRLSGKGLDCISNRKLIHLHDVLSAVKDEFGTREKLIAATAELEGRGKDGDYKQALIKLPLPQLFDRYRSAKKRKA